MRNRDNRAGAAILGVILLALAGILLAAVSVDAKPKDMRGPIEMLYARGSAGIGVDGQVELVLAAITTDETSYTWAFCNDGTDEILMKPGAVKGTALTTPTDNAAGTPGSGGAQVTMGTVGRIPAATCIELDLEGQTAVLQGETTTQAYSVWGTR